MAIDICIIFNVGRRLFFNVFPFPVCKAQLIGDWLANRRGAPNCLVRLFLKPQSTVHIFIEYHSLCPLVGFGTLPPSLLQASVQLPTEPKGGHPRLWVRGWGSPIFEDWRKALYSAYSVSETIGPPIVMAWGALVC
jgi:hypothetical protein